LKFSYSFIIILVVVTFAWSPIRPIWWHMFAFEHPPPVSTVVITCISFLLCERFSFINEKTTPSSENWRARRASINSCIQKGNRLTSTQKHWEQCRRSLSIFFLQVNRRREGHTWETELHWSLLKHGRNRC